MPSWLIPMLTLGFSAGLSNFGGAIGLGVLPLQRRHRLQIVSTFLAAEILMPIFGLVLGDRLSKSIGNRGSLIAGVVLILIGVYTLLETRRETRDLTIPVRMRTVVLLAVALSMDNLAVGFGLGLLHTPVAAAALFMGASSLVLTILGLELGRRLGSVVGDRSELISGAVLIGAGAFVLIRG